MLKSVGQVNLNFMYLLLECLVCGTGYWKSLSLSIGKLVDLLLDSKVNQDVGIICVHFSRANLFEYKVEMEFLIAEYKMI